MIAQVTPVPSATNNKTPSYTFNATEPGVIIYGGNCSSNTKLAKLGDNSVIFNSLLDGNYGNCSIKVRDNATNESNLLLVNQFTIDTISPTITSVSSSNTDGIYYTGDNISIKMNFSEKVNINNTNGSPKIKLNIDSKETFALYQDGSGTNTISFLYNIKSGDNSESLNYFDDNSFIINGSLIKDNAGNTAITKLPVISSNNSLAGSKNLSIVGIKLKTFIKSNLINQGISGIDKHYPIAINDNTLVVGFPDDNTNYSSIHNSSEPKSLSPNTMCPKSGAVYVYRKNNDKWSQEAYIKPSNNYANLSSGYCTSNNNIRKFGYSVAIDGDYIAVGVPYDNSNQTSITNGTNSSTNNDSKESGAVFIYKRNGTNWQQAAYIKSNVSEAGDWFGKDVDIACWDSNCILAVGAPGYDGWYSQGKANPFNDSGGVFLFKNSGGATWEQIFSHENICHAGVHGDSWFDSGANDKLGYSVSIAKTIFSGTFFVLAGAPAEASDYKGILTSPLQSNDNSARSGAAYLFDKSCNIKAKFKAPNNVSDLYGGYNGALLPNWYSGSFGHDVSIQYNQSPDNDTEFYLDIAVGSPYEKNANNQIINDNASLIQNNIGSYSVGAAYLFRMRNNYFPWPDNYLGNNEVYEFKAYIKLSNPSDNKHMHFGSSLSFDNNTLIIGSMGESSAQRGHSWKSSTDTNSEHSGAAYVYKNSQGKWKEVGYIKAFNSVNGNLFGKHVSIDDNNIVVSAPNDRTSNFPCIDNNPKGDFYPRSDNCPSGNTSQGAVYIYE